MSTRALLFAVGLALAAVPGACARAEPNTPAVPRADIPGLPNFAQVAPGLYRSAQPTAEGLRAAKAMGIRTVVNLRALHSDRALLGDTGLGYVHIRSTAWHPEDEDIVAFLTVALDPARQPVLVHCEHGADRTGLMVATYRRAVQGWTLDEALAELPAFGFHEVWVGIRRALERQDPAALKRRAEAAR
jgi:protein tyrosine/serine phosphatase